MPSELPYVYAALLDVLGYRHHLQQDRDSATLNFKDALQRALQVLGKVNESQIFYQAISDTIILTCSRRDQFIPFLETLKEVQISFLMEGLFVRGGITYAQHFKSTHVTYSHALATAYELENKVAVYPRVVIDHNIVDMLRTAEELQALASTQLVLMHNGVYYLNILDSDNWDLIYEKAKVLFLAEQEFLRGREPEFAKHLWFERYLLNSPHNVNQKPFYIPQPTFVA